MRRSSLTVALLGALVSSALSCQFAVVPTAPDVSSLPPVAAAPRGAVAPPVAAEDEPVVAAVADYLREKRRTRLADFELAPLARTIVAEAKRHDLEVSLVLAVIHVESRYNTYAVSPVGAMGLMQIMPATGEELARFEGVPWRGSQTLFDPIVNVRLGVRYLRHLANRYESIPTALAAYNWGPGRIDRRIRRGTPLPTEYPSLVLEAYNVRYAARSTYL